MSVLDNIAKVAYRNARPHEHDPIDDPLMRSGISGHLYLHHGVSSMSETRNLDSAAMHMAHTLAHLAIGGA